MRSLLRTVRALTVVSLLATAHLRAQTGASFEQYFNVASPLELTSARTADRVAFVVYDRGMRNVYTAAAPNFRPVRLTRYLNDDGRDLTDVRLSDDGTIAVFVRGSAPNRSDWIANPSHRPEGEERAIWAVRTANPGMTWRVAEGGNPELSPDGRWVLYVKDGQIYRARVLPEAQTDSMQLGLKPFIKAWGRQLNPVWSPDGSRIAFVSHRGDHSFVTVYDVNNRLVTYVSPSVDCDAAPAWSLDGKRIAFIRRPGIPFGRQAQQGTGSIGNPAGPAAGRGAGECSTGGGGGGGQQESDTSQTDERPGLFRATFPGGATVAIMVADVSRCTRELHGCEARELWRNAADDRTFTGINRLMWGADHIVFPASPRADEWDRYYSISASSPAAAPTMLTTTDGLIEGATSAALARDGKTLYYTTNANDIERRHIWAVPTDGTSAPAQLTSGAGIETHPHPLASGRRLAVLYFGVSRPASVALLDARGGEARVVYPTLAADFPASKHVTPEIVIVKSPDGLEVHNQLFLPKDIKPGERRPALIFVHGGPMRQMLPGYHYMQFYHWSYAYNQWLARQGYIVLSVNYRSGIGYGTSFRFAPNTGRRGNSEYQDVLAAGKYLQSRADVDPARVGIWGLSYGGVLTAQALARNSDVFVAGVDLAGVHLWGSSVDTGAVSYKSSAIAEIDNWRSPVFLVHGDDDRNVNFAQTVGLVQLLRARNIHHEMIIIPDDLHESMLHSRWIYTWNKIDDFLRRFVWNKDVATDQQKE